MNTCDVCTLGYHDEKCPNSWRPSKDDELVARWPGMRENTRVHVVRHREAMAAIGSWPGLPGTPRSPISARSWGIGLARSCAQVSRWRRQLWPWWD